MVGELAQATRTLLIGRDHPGDATKTPDQLEAQVVEELADVLDQVLILCQQFDIAPTTLLTQSEQKLQQRFAGQPPKPTLNISSQ